MEQKSTSLGKGKRRRRGIKLEARSKAIKQQGQMSAGQGLRKRVGSFSTGGQLAEKIL